MNQSILIRSLPLLLALLALPARAGLFDDDEARKRIEQLRIDVDERTQRLEQAAKGQALLVNQIEALRAEIAKLRGQIEVNTNDIDQNQKRQKDFYVDLDTRMRKLEAAIAELNQKIAANAAAIAARPAEPVLDPANEPKDYEAAVGFLRAGKHVDAAFAFRQFIKNWPKSSFIPSAHYWAGTALVQARDFEGAVAYFDKVANNWPDDMLAPDAMLALSNCQQELGDSKTSRKTLETLVAKYPKSDAAKTAKQRLTKK
ncbi:tol-pal system protein YbgF [Viridibacterium curvum]|uniref:Cell division coordinator CpoB n=1 Tax=Viridibacterium curvum TaxID=1101404 RepID=A0ABP9QMM8_9RHOO